MSDQFTLSREFIRQLNDLLLWRRNFRVRGAARFENSATACVIDLAGTPRPEIGSRPGVAWLKVLSVAGDIGEEAIRWTYNVEIYDSPFATESIGTALALNVLENENTTSRAGGFDLVALEEAECGDIVGILPIPADTWLQSQGVYSSDAAGDPAPYHAITWKNDPVIKDFE